MGSRSRRSRFFSLRSAFEPSQYSSGFIESDRLKSWATFLAAVGTIAAMTTVAAARYHLLQRVTVVPGIGIWDYVSVDSVNRRVYCPHGDETVVLDADAGSVIGTIRAPQGDRTTGLGE